MHCGRLDIVVLQHGMQAVGPGEHGFHSATHFELIIIQLGGTNYRSLYVLPPGVHHQGLGRERFRAFRAGSRTCAPPPSSLLHASWSTMGRPSRPMPIPSCIHTHMHTYYIGFPFTARQRSPGKREKDIRCGKITLTHGERENGADRDCSSRVAWRPCDDMT